MKCKSFPEGNSVPHPENMNEFQNVFYQQSLQYHRMTDFHLIFTPIFVILDSIFHQNYMVPTLSYFDNETNYQ